MSLRHWPSRWKAEMCFLSHRCTLMDTDSRCRIEGLDLLASPPSESTAPPCLGDFVSKGRLRPTRLCKPACDARSDSAAIRRLKLEARHPSMAEENPRTAGILPHSPAARLWTSRALRSKLACAGGALRRPPGRRSLTVDATASACGDVTKWHRILAPAAAIGVDLCASVAKSSSCTCAVHSHDLRQAA
jgi:hypothetical protein